MTPAELPYFMRLPRKVFGHPLHPMLAMVPLVLWLATPLADVAAWLAGPDLWWRLALGMSAAGVAVGVPTMVVGLSDYAAGAGPADVRLAARHGVRTSLVWCAMTLKLLLVWFLDRNLGLIVGCLLLDLAAAVLLVQGALYGLRLGHRLQ